MNMTVAIRPASLWAQVMFTVVVDLEISDVSAVDLTHDSRGDLVDEFKQLLTITATK